MAKHASGKSAPTGGVNESSSASYSDVDHEDTRDLGEGEGLSEGEVGEGNPLPDDVAQETPNYYTELGQKELRTGEAGNKNFFPDPRDLPHPWAESGDPMPEGARRPDEEKPGKKAA
jgi:hypothetical protein